MTDPEKEKVSKPDWFQIVLILLFWLSNGKQKKKQRQREMFNNSDTGILELSFELKRDAPPS